MGFINQLITGGHHPVEIYRDSPAEPKAYSSWLVVEPPTPLKNDGVKVSWDADYSQYMEK